jgi:hypothetical protein
MAKVLYSFRETKSFTRHVSELLSDEEYAAFQWRLIQFPEAGDLIPAGGGIRKIRCPAKGKGKRGGARVIYYLAAGNEEFFMLEIFPKSEKADLTLPELNDLRKIVEEWLNQ